MRHILKLLTVMTSTALLAASLTACDDGGNTGGGDPRENIVKVEQSSSVPFTYFYHIPEGTSAKPVTGLVLIASAAGQATSYAEVENTSLSILGGYISNLDFKPPPGFILFTVAFNKGESLSRDDLESTTEGDLRVDLKFLKVVNHLKGALAEAGYTLDPQIFVTGFSGGGSCCNRITLLHPTLIKAATPKAVGQPWTMPLASYQGIQFPYHIGVLDFERLGLGPFDLESFKRIPFFVFIGASDSNDGLLECGAGKGCSGLEWYQIVFYTNFFGNTVQERAESFHIQLIALGMNSAFKSYPGVGHYRTSEMDKDVFNFFSSFPLNSP
ncbi:MAG: hypothetical protein OEZ32_11130 [Nitrospinota bacterium]|nr:hypothetical protein [Nitrospinota bacterium]